MKPGEFRKRRAAQAASVDFTAPWGTSVPRVDGLVGKDVADPFEGLVFILHTCCTVKATRRDWVIRCNQCSAGWIIPRPREGCRVSLWSMWQVLNHTLEHVGQGVRH